MYFNLSSLDYNSETEPKQESVSILVPHTHTLSLLSLIFPWISLVSNPNVCVCDVLLIIPTPLCSSCSDPTGHHSQK